VRPSQGPAREVKMRFLDFDDQHFKTSSTEGSE